MPPVSQKQFWRYLATIGLVAIAYFGSAHLTLSILGLGMEASPAWPPAGIALAALLLQGRRVWPGVAIGMFWLNLSLEAPLLLSFGSMLGSTLQAVIGVTLLRAIEFRPTLERIKDALGLVILGAMAATLVNATIGTLVSCWVGSLDWSQFGQNWGTVWLGDSTGILGVTPVLLLLGERFPRRLLFPKPPLQQIFKRKSPDLRVCRQGFSASGTEVPTTNRWRKWRSKPIPFFFRLSLDYWKKSIDPDYGWGLCASLFNARRYESFLCWAMLWGVSWMVFGSKTPLAFSHYPLEYLPFPFVVWAALRFRVWGAVLASLIVSRMAVWGALQGGGPFVVKAGDSQQAILLLQTFMAVVTTTALVLAAAMSERQRAEDQLRATLKHDRLLLEAQVAERTLQLREKMQELQKLYELKDVFLQAVSHDLRTSIMGLLMILKNAQNCQGNTITLTRPILERLIQNSDRQLTLINALSEDHFCEERQLVLHCQPLSLKELVEQLLADLQPLFAKNQATLENLIPDHLPLIRADPEQLRCVFEHLLTNALKHNLPGVKITLDITVEEDMLRCAIADNGVGMSQDQCDRLFKLYLRGLCSQHLTGIGLGLYLCRQIITAHGGRISVHSCLGFGSTFYLTIPRLF